MPKFVRFCSKLEALTVLMMGDYERGKFDTTLVKYNVLKEQTNKSNSSKEVQVWSLIEVWDKYCVHRKPGLAISTYEDKYRGVYLKCVHKIESMPIENIYGYVTTKYCAITARYFLSAIKKCVDWAILYKCSPYGSSNPFVYMEEEAKQLRSSSRRAKKGFCSPFGNEYDDCRAFNKEERDIIIEAFRQSSRYSYLAPVIMFMFLTGARPSEVCELRWRDIGNQFIRISRSYYAGKKMVKDTKTHKNRKFPLVDKRLIQLVSELRTDETQGDDLVFKTPDGRRINMNSLSQIWGSDGQGEAGIVLKLANEGKLRTYLKLYTCRHTFITLQLHALGPQCIVALARWVGNSPEVIYKSYVDPFQDIIPAFI